jgi:predicted transposase YbfD/YdcC
LGQLAAEDKSNEITAIPELINRLEIAGSLITIDAAGCQTAIAEQIIDAKGDYVFALKGNQVNALQETESWIVAQF